MNARELNMTNQNRERYICLLTGNKILELILKNKFYGFSCLTQDYTLMSRIVFTELGIYIPVNIHLRIESLLFIVTFFSSYH